MGSRELLNNIKLKGDQNKPEIMLAVGLIGVIGATVLACRASIKAKDIIDEHNAEMDLVNSDEIDKDDPENKKQIRKLYLKTSLKVARAYAPAVAIETAAFVLLIKSNSVQRDRLAGLTAAYMAVDQAFKKYREAVINEFGEEKDLELRGLKKELITTSYSDEDGNDVKDEFEGYTFNNNTGTYISDYAKYFDSTCPDWSKSPENNLYFLKLQEISATDKLQLQGHLFLNEVYDMLGIPRTKAGQVVGWRYLPDNQTGDNYVKFDIHQLKDEDGNHMILLDFNVDGPIYEYI